MYQFYLVPVSVYSNGRRKFDQIDTWHEEEMFLYEQFPKSPHLVDKNNRIAIRRTLWLKTSLIALKILKYGPYLAWSLATWRK